MASTYITERACIYFNSNHCFSNNLLTETLADTKPLKLVAYRRILTLLCDFAQALVIQSDWVKLDDRMVTGREKVRIFVIIVKIYTGTDWH